MQPLEITVLDRIGGGDGFVGGMLYAILKGWEPEKWLQFGWAAGVLATTLSDRLRPARRRRADLAHLEGQRTRAAMILFGDLAIQSDGPRPLLSGFGLVLAARKANPAGLR